MKEVKYSRNIVDIHPLVVYFVLPDNEYLKYADDIKRLNDYAWVSLGVFEYKSLKQEFGEWVEMPEEFGSMLNDYNMVVKLMDSGDEQSRYMFNHIDLDGDGGAVVDAIRSFVISVSERNIELTDSYIAHLNSCRALDDDKRIYYLGCIKDLLTDALKRRKSKKPLWGDWSSSVNVCCECVQYNDNVEIMSQGERLYGFAGLQDNIYNVLKRAQSKKSASREICKLLEEMGLLEREELAEAESALASGKKASRGHVAEVSDSRIFIVRTLSSTGRKKWGVEIVENGKKHTVLFSGKDQTMLYYAVLLRMKMGQRLYLKELYDNTKADGGGQLIKKWFASLYNIIYRFDDRPFSKWAGKFVGDQHAVNQAKSGCNRALKSVMGRDAEAYLIDRDEDAAKKSFYTLGCNAEDIYIPKELDLFLDSEEVSGKY